jgi:hypothetical protein
METRTPEEVAYDNLKNGSAYVKPDSLAGQFAPPPPASPAVTLTKKNDDSWYETLDSRCGQELGTDFRIGEVLIYLPDDGSTPTIHAFDDGFDVRLVERDFDHIIALLSDPRVQAARRKAA